MLFSEISNSNIIALCLISLALLALIAIITAISWRRQADSYEKLLWAMMKSADAAEEELTALKVVNKQLVDTQVAWGHAWDFVADCVAQGGAVLALATLPEQPTPPAASWQEDEPHQGSKENVFAPVPLCRSKTQRAMQAETPREPVLVLTTQQADATTHAFELLVLRPRDAVSRAMLPQRRPQVFMACIEVSISPKLALTGVKSYNLYIDSVPGISRGATSLAMDQLLLRAQREGVQQITGTLTQSISDEAHRARLYSFYLVKYGFSYDPDSGLLSKQLSTAA